MSDEKRTPNDERVARALGLLAEAARERLRRHPQGHLIAAPVDAAG